MHSRPFEGQMLTQMATQGGSEKDINQTDKEYIIPYWPAGQGFGCSFA